MAVTVSKVSELNLAIVAEPGDYVQVNPGEITVDETLTVNGKIVVFAGARRSTLRWDSNGEFNAVNLVSGGEIHSCAILRNRAHNAAGASRIAVAMTSTNCATVDVEVFFPRSNPAGRVYNGYFIAGTGNQVVRTTVDRCWAGAGIRLNAATNAKLLGSNVRRGTGSGMTIDGACVNCVVGGTVFEDNATEGLEMAQGSGCTIQDCVARRNGEEGFEFKTLSPVQITNLTVERCEASFAPVPFAGFVFGAAGTPPGGFFAINGLSVRSCRSRYNAGNGFNFGNCTNGTLVQLTATDNDGFGLLGVNTNTLMKLGPTALYRNATGNISWTEG